MERDQSQAGWPWSVRRMIKAAGAALVASALWIGTAQAQSQDEWASLAELESAVEQSVSAAEKHVDWAHRKKLFAERDRTCEFLLSLDPDHRLARKHLGFKRDKGGSWERKKPYEIQTNRQSSALEEIGERRTAAITPYFDGLLEYWVASRGALGEREAALVARLMELDPDHATLRAELGQAWDDVRGTWVMRETLRSVGQRAEHVAMLRELGGAVELSEVEPKSEEHKWALPWQGVLEGESVRVIGTVTPAELEECARSVAATQQWLETLCPSGQATEQLHMVVLQSSDELRSLFDKEKKLDASSLGGAVRAAGTWVPQSHTFIVCSADRSLRAEMAIQQTVRWLFQMRYGVATEQSWVYQGMQIYAVTLLLGTSRQLEDGAQARAASASRFGPSADRAGWSEVTTEVLGKTSGRWLSPVGTARGLMSRDVLRRCFVWTRFLMEASPDHFCEWLTHELDQGGAMFAASEGVRLPGGTQLDDFVLRWAGEIGHGGKPALIELTPADQAELLAAIEAMPRGERDKLYERCVAAVESSGARQLELAANWIEKLDTNVKRLPEATDFGAHDATRFKGGPPRRVVPRGSSRWREMRELLPDDRPDPWHRMVTYEFSTGSVVRLPEPEDDMWRFVNLLAGVAPGMDVAEAAMLAHMDRSQLFGKQAEYFAHLYCDRDANAYEDITLFDVWSNKVGLEVPDPDARAFAIKIFDDESVPVPLSEEDHDYWYPRIADALSTLRGHIHLSRALTAIYFNGKPRMDGGYEASTDIMHGLWAFLDEDPDAMQSTLDEDGRKLIGNALAQMESMGNDGWNAGNARRDELAEGAERIRQAVLNELKKASLLP